MNNNVSLVYAPVVIPTLCRYDKFVRCIESLQNCVDSDKTDVFIGLDYPSKPSHWDGYKKIDQYLNNISGFHKVTVIRRGENYGERKNVRSLLDVIEKSYDRYIFSEDDNEFSPNFLLYMNQCLEKYKDSTQVFNVCGYSYMEWKECGPSIGNAFPLVGYCSFGTGFWFNKFRSEIMVSPTAYDIIHSPETVRYLFSKKIHHIIHYLMYRHNVLNSEDIRRICFYNMNDLYSIFPRISKVRNWGYDGESSNCASINTYAQQDIDQERVFVLDDFEIKHNKDIQKLHDIHYGKGLFQRLLVRFEYFQWRFTGKAFKDYTFLRNIIRFRVRHFKNK